MSPVLKPCSAARPLGSTVGDHHPFGASARDVFGRSERQAELRHVAAASSARLRRRWPAAPSASRRASRVMVFSSPLRMMASLTEAPGAIAPIFLARSRASLTALPLTAVMTSPADDAGLGGRAVGLRLGDQRAFAPSSGRGSRRCRR